MFENKESVKGYFWKLKDYDKKLALTIFQKNNVSEIISRLLAIKNVSYDNVKDYLEPKLKNSLKNPYHLIDMDKAVLTICNAIINNKKICIYGDYDVDGATATALLIKFFKNINFSKNISTYIPDRIDEGYSLNNKSIEFIKKNNVDLILTVDCGITSKEQVDYANEIGIDIVITDHHLGPSDLP